MRYAILGGGAVVSEFYLPALTLLGSAARTVVVDPFESSLEPIDREFPEVTTVRMDHATFLDGLSATGEERVIVALPNALHIDAVERALGRGRHVLCEKPLALNAASCAGLVERAKVADRRLKVAMSRRYLASWKLAGQMVRAGELGAVTAIEARDCSPFLWRPRSFAFFARESGGVLADMGVHYLDFLDTLVGPLTPVSYSDDARGGTESSLVYELKAGEVPVRLRLSRLHPAGAFVRITGERGEILIDKTNETGVHFTPSGGGRRAISLEQPFDEPAWPSDFHGSFCQMLADFERAIGGQACDIADGEDAVRATGLIEWAYSRRRPPAKVAGKPVLVTGGTGFIGGHLVERLTGAGETVRASVRSPNSLANLARFPVEMTPTDLLDPASARAAANGCRTVFHLAYGKEGDAARITIEGTKSIVEAAIAEGAECVVVLSTMYVYGFPPGAGPVDETYPYRPYGGEYGTSKAAMERWCLERAKTSGATRVVVLNPTCVFGPEGGAYTSLPVDLAREGRFCWIEDGQGACNYIYVDNLVDAIEAAADTPGAHGQRFILNDGTTSWRDFLEPFLAPLNVDIPNYSRAEFNALPRFGGRFRWRDLARAAISCERVREVAKRSALVRRRFEAMGRAAERQGRSEHAFSYRPVVEEPPAAFPPDWLADLYSPAKASFSADKARRVLGWTPKIALGEAQRLTLDWLRQTGRLL